MVGPEALELERFKSLFFTDVEAKQIPWDDAWDELLRYALYSEGPDVSEVGSTWLGSLVEMQALRPLSAWYLDVLQRQEMFFPAARWGVMRAGDPRIWAVPLTTDTRVIYYRRGWLTEAGVDEATAFKSPEAMADTLERLQASGHEMPLAMPTTAREVIYTSASWVWGAGGRFRTRDGRNFRLHEQEAQRGLQGYFALHRFLTPLTRAKDIAGTDDLFVQGRAAVCVSGPWMVRYLANEPEIMADVGAAQVPGIPFVGGTHLVLWRHAESEMRSVKLLQHLTSVEVQRRCFQDMHVLPARIEVLEDEPFSTDPVHRVFADSLRAGRVFTISYRWAAVEGRLVALLSSLWDDLAEDPDLDLEAEINKRTRAMVDTLEKTILTTW